MKDLAKIMQQAQQMQFKLQEMQEKLKDVYVEGESGGGMVKVVMSCGGEVKSITIDPSVIDASDKDTLEDLVVAAMNNANDVKEQRIKDETQSMMEGMGLPKDTQWPM